MKSLALVFGLVLILTGCDGANTISPSRDSVIGTFYTQEYDGHMWVCWQVRTGYAGSGGIVHHPDCPCHLLKKWNTTNNE